MDSEATRKEIVSLGKFLYERGYLLATDGNISACRREKGVILITPRGKCKGELSVKEIGKISLTGKVISGDVSSEWRMHLACYKGRKDIRAVIHAHPPWTTLISLRKGDLEPSLLPEAEIYLREMRSIPYHRPGSKELADAVFEVVTKNPRVDIFILKRHGAIVLGKDLRDARFKLERLEFFSFLFYLMELRGRNAFSNII